MIAAGGIVALAILALAGNSLGRYFGWTVDKVDPAALSALIAPSYRVTKPDGGGKFPVALLFSGCDGPQDNVDRWAAALATQGWASVIVDSHGPRGLDDYEKWRLICAGQLLMGSERAGDVLVAIADARRMPFVDPTRIALVGASHGGWAIMDLFALDPPHGLPFNLAAAPAGPADPLDGVVAAILLYPYCGQANRAAREGGWQRPIPTLFLLSGNDTIAPARHCLDVAGDMQARGLPVATHVFEGVTHGFDQQNRAAFSTLQFDPEATAEAIARAEAFLAAADPG